MEIGSIESSLNKRKYLPQLSTWSFLQLKMANLIDLKGFAICYSISGAL